MDRNIKQQRFASIDIVIPVEKIGNRFKEVIDRLQRQTVIVNKVFILNLITEDRYNNIEKADGIVNFTYEDGDISFNGVETKSGDVINFKALEGSFDIEVMYYSQKEIQTQGLYRKILEISNAEYVLCMLKDTMPLNKYMISNLLEPFKDEDVMVSLARQMGAKQLSYVEKNEFTLNRITDSGIVEIDTMKKLPYSAFWSFNSCAVYRRSILEEFANKDIAVSAWNEDLAIFKSIFDSGMKIAFADVDVMNYKKMTTGYIYKRSYEIAKISEVSAMLHRPGKKRVLRTSFRQLLIKGRGYMAGELMVYFLVVVFGIASAKLLSNKVTDRIYSYMK